MNQPDIEAVFVDALQNVAEGVTELLGFEVAAISIARDDHTLEMVAVAGSPAAREQLMGRRTPIADIERELATAEAWGDLRFVPHEQLSIEVDDLGWVSDLEPTDDPNAWHPLDLLLAPIYDEHSRFRGLLSVDLPRDGRRPDAVQQEQLQRYARQTRRNVLTAVERAELAEHVRLADAARKIVREVSSELSIGRIVELCQPAITSGLGAVGMWLQTFDGTGRGSDSVYGATESDIHVPEELQVVGRRAAHLLWSRQQVAVVTRSSVPDIAGLVLDEGQARRLLDFMVVTLEASSMLFVPIGAGPECVGSVALTRRGRGTEWNVLERQTALEIGHDLGRALVNARTFERERQVLEELQELAGYKSRLIATIAHELKNPLASILGHLDLVGLDTELSSSVTESTEAMGRAVDRMRSIVDDLLLLAQVADPKTASDTVPVDLVIVVGEVLDLLGVTAAQKDLTIVVDVPPGPVIVRGETHELFQLCANLLSNAMRYTPAGGTIDVTLSRLGDDVELSVADTGIGISVTDQHRLFDEFFRSTNPEALAIPGTGLGLSIVHRIAERHHGRIDVESALGAGTTFRFTLPAELA